MKRHRTCNPLKNKQAANRGGRLAAVILLSRHIECLKPFMGIACEFGAWWRRPAHFFLDCRAYASENLSPMPQKDFAKTEMARGLNINIPLPTLSVPPAFGGKATMMASSSSDKLVDFDSFGPVGRSATEPRCFHFATVFGLIP
jgi:hypothetical protein